MTTDRGTLAALLATMTMLASASPAMAQTEQAAPVRGLEGLANPAPQTSTTIPIPAAPTIVLPTVTPTPRRAPRTRTTATPVAERPAASEPREAAPRTRASDTETRPPATVEATPAAAPTPDPVPTPEPALSTEATPQTDTPIATPTPSPQPTLTAPETGRAMPLWLSLAVVVVVLAALWALRRKPRNRRPDRIERETVIEPVAEPAAPPAEPVVAPTAPVATAAIPATAVAAPKFLEPRAKAPPPPPPAPRARVTCDLRPLRAGLNLLSATVECELVVTNTGNAPAEAIRTGVALLTAHAAQDTDLAQFNAAPIGRPATPPFALAPGETRTIRTVVAIAREAIQTMTAANRPMFVPVVATNILYVTAGDEAQTARAWVIGIERVDSAKLAPFWLDAPPRMYTTVAARPHAATFER
jgi:hypothetical protein